MGIEILTFAVRECCTAASGLNWSNVGTTKPANGTELTNESLATALQKKNAFLETEWAAFNITDLCYEQYIKAGESYFQPAAWTPKYMKGRQTLGEELEESLPDIPFETFTLMSGQGRKRTRYV